MNKTAKIVLWIVVIALVIWGISCLNKKAPAIPATGEAVKIGAVFALSGDAAAWGEASRNGAMMAVEEVNANGGINGQPIDLIIEDMRSTSVGSLSAVSKLIDVDKVKAIVGPSWLDVYQGPENLVKDNNIILLSPDAGIEAINGEVVHRNIFSNWYRTDVKARMMTEYMAKNGVKKLAGLYQNDPYYIDFSNRIKKYAELNGIQVVATEMVNSGVTDVRTPSLKLKAANPDAIMFGLYDEKAVFNFLSVRKQSFPSIALYGDESVADHYQKPDYVGLYENTTYFHATQPASDFKTKYMSRYKVEPVFGAAPAYDDVMIISRMLKDKGLDVDYNDYLRTTTFDTVSYGPMKFDKIGGAETPNNQFDFWQINNNQATKLN